MVDVEQEIDEQKFFDSNDSLDTLLEEFKRENTKVYPNVGDCLVEFLIGKKNVGKEVRLCPRCSTMFDKTTTKSLEKSESIKRAYEDAARRKDKRNQSNLGVQQLLTLHISLKDMRNGRWPTQKNLSRRHLRRHKKFLIGL